MNDDDKLRPLTREETACCICGIVVRRGAQPKPKAKPPPVPDDVGTGLPLTSQEAVTAGMLREEPSGSSPPASAPPANVTVDRDAARYDPRPPAVPDRTRCGPCRDRRDLAVAYWIAHEPEVRHALRQVVRGRIDDEAIARVEVAHVAVAVGVIGLLDVALDVALDADASHVLGRLLFRRHDARRACAVAPFAFVTDDLRRATRLAVLDLRLRDQPTTVTHPEDGGCFLCGIGEVEVARRRAPDAWLRTGRGFLCPTCATEFARQGAFGDALLTRLIAPHVGASPVDAEALIDAASVVPFGEAGRDEPNARPWAHAVEGVRVRDPAELVQATRAQLADVLGRLDWRDASVDVEEVRTTR